MNVLHVAADKGLYGVLQWSLVDAPEKVQTKAFKLLSEKNNNGLNVLHVAAASGDFKALEWLLVDLLAWAPGLLGAPENVKAEVFKWLSEKSDNGLNILHFAAASGKSGFS